MKPEGLYEEFEHDVKNLPRKRYILKKKPNKQNKLHAFAYQDYEVRSYYVLWN
jgi:hypothetical protein